jgi:hypothetical protein
MIERGRSVGSVWVALFMLAAGCSSGSHESSGGAGGGYGSGGSAGGPSVAGSCGTGTGGTGTGGSAGIGGQGGQPTCAIPGGTGWVEIPVPSDQSGFRATDAFALGTNDILFAGSTVDPTGVVAPSDGRLLRWSQGCWTVELTFATSSAAPASASVHGTGPNDVWATAGDLIYHRDAHGWAAFTDEGWRNMVVQPSSFFGSFQFNRVRAAAAGDFWIAATANVLHFSNEAWTAYNFDEPGFPQTSASIGYSFNDIWIDSPSAVWVVGPSKQIGNTMSFGFVHEFDGASWTHTGVGVFSIYAIWRGGSVLWLAQPSRDLINGQGVVVPLRAFDGTNAPGVQVAGVDPTQFLPLYSRLWGRGASDVWAAGEDVAHFDGQGWSTVPDEPAAARNESDISNTFVTGDDGSVWLVTPGPHFFRKVTGP